MAAQKEYEPDEDGLPREIVGEWVNEKHERLRKYVGISSGVRSKFIGPGKAGASYIELYCGPGRARIEGTNKVIDGSTLVAWKESVVKGAPFSVVHIADAEKSLVGASASRLRKATAPVVIDVGKAIDTADRIISKLNPYGLHFAFLDPYNLAALPFQIIRKLSATNRMDILIHISVQDLQRNLRAYSEDPRSPLDAFAPGWRDRVDLKRRDFEVRAAILEYWKHLVEAEGMSTARTFEKVTGPKNQPLYWLAFAARHELALEFWDQIRNISGQGEMEV